MTPDLGVLLPHPHRDPVQERRHCGCGWSPTSRGSSGHDPRITAGELDALQRYAAAPADPRPACPPRGVTWPPRWARRARCTCTGTFITAAATAPARVRARPRPSSAPSRRCPGSSRFPRPARRCGLPTRAGLRQVLRTLHRRPQPAAGRLRRPRRCPATGAGGRTGTRRVEAGVAGIDPRREPDRADVDALYVTGLGDGDPADAVRRPGRRGPAGPARAGPAHQQRGRRARPPRWPPTPPPGGPCCTATAGDSEQDVSRGADRRSGPRWATCPAAAEPHRRPAAALVTALWPALWGFAAEPGVRRRRAAGPAPSWAARGDVPRGRRTRPCGSAPQPYGLLPDHGWTLLAAGRRRPSPARRRWSGAAGSCAAQHAAARRARGTAAGEDTDGLLDLIGRHAHVRAASGTGRPGRWSCGGWRGLAPGGRPTWPAVDRAWADQLPAGRPARARPRAPLRRAARGRAGSRTRSSSRGDCPTAPRWPTCWPRSRGDGADNPAAFASTASLEAACRRHGDSLLLRLAIRSLQVAIGDLGRAKAGQGRAFDPEPLVRASAPAGPAAAADRRGAEPADVTAGSPRAQRCGDVTAAPARHWPGSTPAGWQRCCARPSTLRRTGSTRGWWPCRTPRLDALLAAGTAAPDARRLRLGGRARRPVTPGPTPAGLLHTPSPSSGAGRGGPARPGGQRPVATRWDLRHHLAHARAAAGSRCREVRTGAHLAEAMGREVERIVGRTGPTSDRCARVPGAHRARRPARLRRACRCSPPTRPRSPWTPTRRPASTSCAPPWTPTATCSWPTRCTISSRAAPTSPAR